MVRKCLLILYNSKHYRDAGRALETWRTVLALNTVADIKRIPFEQEIDRLLESGLRPGTVENRARFLTGFYGYAKEHGLLAEDPLESWPGLDTTPEVVHGRLDPAEIRQLLTCPAVKLKRKIIYGLAYFCRLRRSEIKTLTVRSMDWIGGGVKLDYRKVKNRDPEKCWVPVPQPLLGWIWENCLGRGLDEPLTSISKNNAIKYFRRDLKRAKIPQVKDRLERTFHGLGASPPPRTWKRREQAPLPSRT
jgi:integrase